MGEKTEKPTVIDRDKTETDKTSIEKLLSGNFNRIALIKLFIIALVAIGMSLFHMYTSGFGVVAAWQQRSLTLSFTLLLIPLLYPFKSGNNFTRLTVDIIYFMLTLLVVIYTLQVYPDILFRETTPSIMDKIFGSFTVLLVLEGTRRTIGAFMSILVSLFVLYVYFGDIIPGLIGHPGFSFEKMIATYYNTTQGIFGTILGTMSNYILVFIIFGAFLAKSQAGKFFIDLAISLTGTRAGGPAKASVFASGLMGSIQGVAVSNVVTTGTLTIPLMKRVGYKPHVAGGIEAAASCGGQLMPPIMGASAFIIAANLQIPYTSIIFYALVPALLHFVAVFFMVHFEAMKNNLRGIPKNELPDKKKIFTEGWFLILPIILIIALLVLGYSPQYTGFFSILSIVVVSFFRKRTRMSFQDILAALELGGRNAISVVIIGAAAGLLVGSVTLSGFGLKFSSLIFSVAGDSIFITLVLIMLMSILMGMGMPTVSAYIVLAVLGAPALVNLGVEPIAAHFFIFFFAIMSNVTPPVAVAAYAAGAVAHANPNSTGIAAFKICIGTFMIPYMFVYGPGLLMQGSVGSIILVCITALIGIIALTSALQGWLLTKMNILERGLGFVSACLLMFSGVLTDAFGIVLLVVVMIVEIVRFKKQNGKQPLAQAKV